MLLRRAICAAWLARRWTQRRVSRCRRLRGHSHHHRLWQLLPSLPRNVQPAPIPPPKVASAIICRRLPPLQEIVSS